MASHLITSPSLGRLLFSLSNVDGLQVVPSVVLACPIVPFQDMDLSQVVPPSLLKLRFPGFFLLSPSRVVPSFSSRCLLLGYSPLLSSFLDRSFLRRSFLVAVSILLRSHLALLLRCRFLPSPTQVVPFFSGWRFSGPTLSGDGRLSLCHFRP